MIYATTHPRNNPYLAVSNVYLEQVKVMIGSPQDSNTGDGINGSLDNITNHNLAGS